MDGYQEEVVSDALRSFALFYRELYRVPGCQEGRTPYQWQFRLLRIALETGEWPDEIIAPTGAGKTCVIEVHIFLNGYFGIHDPLNRMPRRLILTVNRRALVDSQYEHAAWLKGRMEELADTPGVVSEIRRGLIARAGSGVVARQAQEGFGLVEIRGGAEMVSRRNHDWRINPTQTAVICITPDMFGSRLLFRGYGLNKNMRAVEAGLFAYDSVAVIDEAHLNRQLVMTARQVRRLEQFGDKSIGVHPLQVVVATATPIVEGADGGAPVSISIEEDDYKIDVDLKRRMCNPKPVRTVTTDSLFSETGIESAVQACLGMWHKLGGTIGCVVNTPRAAIEISQKLEKMAGKDSVVCLVGRMRPWDRSEIEKTGALSPVGCEVVHYVVGTQTIEVGINPDFSGLVTEIASASALVQRAGRVNRFGLRDEGPICVIDTNGASRPYEKDDIERARKWMEGCGGDGMPPCCTLSSSNPLPQQDCRRVAWQRLEIGDLDYLCNTSEELSPESKMLTGRASNIDLWLRDELPGGDADISVIVRKRVLDDNGMLRLIELVPPDPREMVSVGIVAFRDAVSRYVDAVDDTEELRNFICIRHNEESFAWPKGGFSRKESKSCWDIQPGDIYVIDEEAPLFARGVIIARESVADARKNESAAIGKEDIYLKLVNEQDLGHEYPDMPIPIYIPKSKTKDLSRELIDEVAESCLISLGGSEGSEAACDTQSLLSWASSNPTNQQFLAKMLSSIITETCEHGAMLSCIQEGDSLDEGYVLVYSPSRRSTSGWRQEAGVIERKPVLLNEHQAEAAARISSILVTLGLEQSVSDALLSAEKNHDEGKRAVLMQQLFRLSEKASGSIAAPLAKSRHGSWARQQVFRRECGLEGWRHEQLSAAIAWSRFNASDEGELITRLVGTSHGRGRSTFDDGSDSLLSKTNDLSASASLSFFEPRELESIRKASIELYDQGVWEEIIESTNLEYGYWGVAYLEALLRGADAQVSSEGR